MNLGIDMMVVFKKMLLLSNFVLYYNYKVEFVIFSGIAVYFEKFYAVYVGNYL